MLKEAIDYILKLKRPETVEIEGRNYATIDLYQVKDPECLKLNVTSLQSLIDYIKQDPDNLKENMKILEVQDELNVKLHSQLFGQFKQRETYMSANYSELTPHIAFGKFISIEEFIIMLKSKFEVTEDLTKIIQIIGNISDENVTNYNDDGITQKVTTKVGIARVGEKALPTKLILKPFRTFIEVEQPESDFLLRVKKGYEGIEVALFEADGGAWKKEAVKNITEYLKNELRDIKNLTILN